MLVEDLDRCDVWTVMNDDSDDDDDDDDDADADDGNDGDHHVG